MAGRKVFRSNRDTVRVAPLDTATLSYLLILLGLLQLLALPQATAGPRYSSRIVDTQSGGIRGIILEPHSRHLEPVEAFLGVPYAISERLKPPRPPLRWEGTKLADAFGPVCPQKYPDISNKTAALTMMPKGRYQQLRRLLPLLTNQSENCLNLNIYVPASGNRGLEAPYAVLIWIHGDSYEWGSGNPYDGSVLASHGHVIVITLNFRLGLLGFLKTRSGSQAGVSGGNLALRDIAMALLWTKKNIASFSGDPNRITLIGQGVGAAMANIMLLLPEAKGTFVRMILFGGSALSPWALVQDPDSLRIAVTEQFDCDKDKREAEDLEICLRKKPLNELLDVRIDGSKFMSRWGPHNPIDQGVPDVKQAFESSSDDFLKCGLMLGVATMESYLDFSATEIQYGFEEDYRNKVLRTYIRNAYVYHLNEIYAAVRNEYTDWDKPIQHPINIRDSTMEALSDGHTAAPMLKLAVMHAKRGATTYLMHFAYQTKESEYPQRLGSVTGEPIAYVFGQPLVGGLPNFPANFTRQDAAVSEAVLTMVATFAKVSDPNGRPGDPTPPQYADYGREKTKYKNINWTPYDISTQQYLYLGVKPKMKSHYRGHKMALWLNLIPQLHQPGAQDVSLRHHHFRERDPLYYTGPVRSESYTLMFARAELGLSNDKIDVTDCEPSVEELGEATEDQSLGEDEELEPEKEKDLLQKLANKHFYNYTAALGVTVGIGCFLLMVNLVIFIGIYYQREQSRKKRKSNKRMSHHDSLSEGSTEKDCMDDEDQEMQCTIQPPPLYRTRPAPKSLKGSSSSQEGTKTTKKRVHIQEISV